MPSRQQIWEALPPRERVESWVAQAKEFLQSAAAWIYAEGVFFRDEFVKARAMGLGPYAEEAKPRFQAWATACGEQAYAWYERITNANPPEGEDEDEPQQRPEKRKKSQGIANRITSFLQRQLDGNEPSAAKRPAARPAAAEREAPMRGRGGRRRPRAG